MEQLALAVAGLLVGGLLVLLSRSERVRKRLSHALELWVEWAGAVQPEPGGTPFSYFMVYADSEHRIVLHCGYCGDRVASWSSGAGVSLPLLLRTSFGHRHVKFALGIGQEVRGR